MSAPQTNIPTQRRWHRAPIIGIVTVVVFALALLFWQMVIVADGTTGSDASPPAADQTDAVPESQPVTPPADPPTIPAGDPPATPDGDLPVDDPVTPDPDLPTEPLPDTGTPDN